MREQDGELIIEQTRPRSLLALLAALDPIEEPLPLIDDPAPEPVTL